jgi:sugar lactone lactonase YvrE
MKHLAALTCLLLPLAVRAAEPARTWVPATAHAIPKYTATEGEGYFSIIEGHNGKLYIGTHANGVNSWLVEFDPKSKEMKVVVDAHKEIGKDLKGFGSQAKIHTRNNTGASGKIYFGTKQGYPSKTEKREDYPGGYPMVYDPATGKTKVYPIPVPHEGINSITPDEERGVAYISTCSDHRPGPGENAHFLVLDLKTEKYKKLIDTQHIYGFIVVDHEHRAYHPMLGGDIVRYDPKTEKLERLKQTIDDKPVTPESHLADKDGHPINWDITPDGKTMYCVPMSTNQLYIYDLTQKGETLNGKSLGELVPGAKSVDCRALCVGPKGEAWAAVTAPDKEIGGNAQYLVSYRPGDKTPRNHGILEVTNPNFTEFTKDGKPLPFHGGFMKTKDGKMTTKYVVLGVCQTNGDVFTLALHPYSVLQVKATDLTK